MTSSNKPQIISKNSKLTIFDNEVFEMLGDDAV